MPITLLRLTLTFAEPLLTIVKEAGLAVSSDQIGRGGQAGPVGAVAGVESEHAPIVGKRVPALGCAGQVPGVAAGSGQAVPDAGGESAAQPGGELVATAE